MCQFHFKNKKKMDDDGVVGFEQPSSRTQGLVVHYGPDGVQPVYREFENASEARLAFSRLVDFKERLRSKGLCAQGTTSSDDAILLYVRRSGRNLWTRERSSGSGVARLSRWVDLHRPALMEGIFARVFAYMCGCLLRGLLYIFVQRFDEPLSSSSSKRFPAAGLSTRENKWLARLAGYGLGVVWPEIRASVNDTVSTRVPKIVNGAIAKLAKKPIEKITSMSLDVGPYAPKVTSISFSQSSRPDCVDVDMGVSLPGDGVKFQVGVSTSVSSIDDDQQVADVTGTLRKCRLTGSVRIKLCPLITSLPCAAFASVGFTAKPRLELETEFRRVTQSSAASKSSAFSAENAYYKNTNLEAIERFFNRLVENVVDNLLCWPRHVKIPIAELLLGKRSGDVERDGEGSGGRRRSASFSSSTSPTTSLIGTLRVEVLRCSGLINNGTARGLSDPYVVCRVGQQEERTTALSDTVDPVWPNPRTFLFDVHESSQLCTVSVYDSEASNIGTFNDSLLGRATFRLADVRFDSPSSQPTPPRGGSPRHAQHHHHQHSHYQHGAGNRPPELRLSLDTSVYDGGKARRRTNSSAHLLDHSNHPDSAVFLLAKFAPNNGRAGSSSSNRRNAVTASRDDEVSRGLAPVGVALAVVVALAVLVDLVARSLILSVVNVLVTVFVTTAGAALLIFTLVLLVGAIV